MAHLAHYLHDPEVHFILGRLGRVLIAALLGAVIGYERERHERPAGMRTHMLVAIGASLITCVDDKSGGRIAAQIVTGVGFLGAGTIIRDNAGVRGLTTAASVWAVAGIGIGVGLGFPYAAIAVGATLLAFFTLTVLSRFERVMGGRRRRQRIRMIIATGDQPVRDLSEILHAIRHAGAHTNDVDFEDVPGGQKLTVDLTLGRDVNRRSIETALKGIQQVANYEWDD